MEPLFLHKIVAMAKSRETFNKRNRELKKQKQKEDKLQKKEERKSQGSSGKNLEDMLAYVDENGNLSSTPPEQSSKPSI
jgi:hypothetical protein